MKKITRKNFLGALFAAALALGIPGCYGENKTDNASLEQKAEKSETGRKVVLNSQSPITNFGFYGYSVCYTASKSRGSFAADDAGKVMMDYGVAIIDAGELIQYMLPSEKGIFIIAGGKAREYAQTGNRLEERVEDNASASINIIREGPFDFYGGKYWFRDESLPEEVKERDRLRKNLNEKLGYIGINHASQIRVNDNQEVQVVYRKEEKTKENKTNYKLVVKTLDKKGIGDELYQNIVRAYGKKP